MDVGEICTATDRMGMTVRDLQRGDRPAVEDALIACGAFSDQEVRVALEMVDAGFNGDYTLPSVEIESQVRAYACIGKATLTSASWYIYWICVHPSYQRMGAGRRLQQQIEELVRAAGGERLVLETSGRPDYERTRRFYCAAGFIEAGRIPDFYKRGDDCVIFAKELV